VIPSKDALTLEVIPLRIPLEAQLTEANPPPPEFETGEDVVDPIEKAA
jgi:hypothetical protein